MGFGSGGRAGDGIPYSRIGRQPERGNKNRPSPTLSDVCFPLLFPAWFYDLFLTYCPKLTDLNWNGGEGYRRGRTRAGFKPRESPTNGRGRLAKEDGARPWLPRIRRLPHRSKHGRCHQIIGIQARQGRAHRPDSSAERRPKRSLELELGKEALDSFCSLVCVFPPRLWECHGSCDFNSTGGVSLMRPRALRGGMGPWLNAAVGTGSGTPHRTLSTTRRLEMCSCLVLAA